MITGLAWQCEMLVKLSNTSDFPGRPGRKKIHSRKALSPGKMLIPLWMPQKHQMVSHLAQHGLRRDGIWRLLEWHYWDAFRNFLVKFPCGYLWISPGRERSRKKGRERKVEKEGRRVGGGGREGERE
jgi:hypothetical protein